MQRAGADSFDKVSQSAPVVSRSQPRSNPVPVVAQGSIGAVWRCQRRVGTWVRSTWQESDGTKVILNSTVSSNKFEMRG